MRNVTVAKRMSTLAMSIFLSAGFLPAEALSAEEVVGITQPIHEIDLAFPDIGVIAEIPFKEGDQVKKGDILARLDSQIHETRLKIARIKAGSLAGIKAANATLGMRERRYNSVKSLGSRSSNADELARAKVDYETAQANLEAAEEESKAAMLELQQIEEEIERRIIRSPIDGIVSRIFLDEAESVGTADTTVVTVVNLDRLDIVIHLDSEHIDEIGKGAEIPVRAIQSGRTAKAVVEFVSPVVDSSSGTARIRLRMDNQNREHLSGVKYIVEVPKMEAAVQQGSLSSNN